MRPRQAPKYFYVVVTLVAVVLVVAGWFAYATRQAKLTALQQTLRAKQTELNNIEPEIARRPQLEAEYTDLQTRLAILEPTLPTYAYVPTLVRQLERLTNETDNKLDGIKPQPSRDKQKDKAAQSELDSEPQSNGNKGDEEAAAKEPTLPYDSVDIDVELQGTYWTTVKFLEYLQKFPKMIAVNEMVIRPSCTPTPAASPKLKVQIAIKAVVTKGGE
ncbi:hypothetical protein AMK68_00500 [candidate division KD3-62 bacterium DG_56]|uniref:Pilus assembly protein PilO n=1 Tax=candidate division KD3-62 bacterium DG_56 TaxID=1704032 RepID=A0A0S7XQM5_9BACT|nr:MAG: hypothetical protein AMK68_00500 [candidate division KD3-62 bacterium DG_56]